MPSHVFYYAAYAVALDKRSPSIYNVIANANHVHLKMMIYHNMNV